MPVAGLVTSINWTHAVLQVSQDRIQDRLGTAWHQLVEIVTDLIIVAIVFLLARALAKFIQRRIWRRIPIDEVTPATESLLNNTVALSLYALAFTATLAFLGASWSSLLTAFSISTIAVVFGLADLLKSILGGAFLIFERPYQVGDRVKIRDNEGEITEIGVRTTTMLTDDHATVIIPNSLHLSEPFRNLDRQAPVSTVIRVIGINGQPVDVRQAIEQILGTEPAINSSVATSSNAQHSWLDRTLEILSNHGIGRVRRHELEDPNTIRARVMLKVDQSTSRETEAEAVRRLQAAFPDAIVAVRRSTLFEDERQDVD
jgi:small-conductance mechanosensitive channel